VRVRVRASTSGNVTVDLKIGVRIIIKGYDIKGWSLVSDR
jgi:hypothetical protein